jgi:hypothetical protein
MATDSEPTTISISPIKLSVQYSGEKLDKLKSNYREWCEDVTIGLSLDGDTPQVPYPSIDRSWPTVPDAYRTSYAECRRDDSSHMQSRRQSTLHS